MRDQSQPDDNDDEMMDATSSSLIASSSFEFQYSALTKEEEAHIKAVEDAYVMRTLCDCSAVLSLGREGK
tara:strand:- start:190 stop:399 length:210 start_codon:yes stop_codon:yes gene_type:complete